MTGDCLINSNQQRCRYSCSPNERLQGPIKNSAAETVIIPTVKHFIYTANSISKDFSINDLVSFLTTI